jgi:hypothetical protein
MEQCNCEQALELKKDKKILQKVLLMLMKSIPEEQLHKIPDEVKLACMLHMETADELLNEK